jgi:acetyl-CoA carboxylase biotin carboxyl carrier protein
MDLKEIKQLLKLMDEHGLTEFALERADEKLMLRREGRGVALPPAPASLAAHGYAAPAAPALAAPAAPAVPAEAKEDEAVRAITSPMVGTFYASPSPDSEPYAHVGGNVGPDTVVCIIEAMKIMNEIKAELSGAITQVCVKNGQSVEFGQVLFKVRVN